MVSILSGPIGTAKDGWPSTLRGTPALPSLRIEMDEKLNAIEENGFLILDFTPEKMTAQFYKWNVNMPEEAIDPVSYTHLTLPTILRV